MTDTWVVILTYHEPADQQRLVRYEDALADHEAFIAALPGRGFTVTMHIDGPDLVNATGVASAIARPVVPTEPVGVEVWSESEYERRADEPTLPELVSAPEIADILGVSRQRVHQLQDTAAFPEPLYRLRAGPVWALSAVEHFARTWERKPGRPARSANAVADQDAIEPVAPASRVVGG